MMIFKISTFDPVGGRLYLEGVERLLHIFYSHLLLLIGYSIPTQLNATKFIISCSTGLGVIFYCKCVKPAATNYKHSKMEDKRQVIRNKTNEHLIQRNIIEETSSEYFKSSFQTLKANNAL